ncbi:hypothetical protein SAMN04487970_103960 [Paenibacillus tianmuensis]|uniref:Uncharacterized protein n=1 Tax=Paenibacillus tianmuensis TaxID=624147 RepID=A0A1G4T186_9BACL|nr:hypothetical protein SAMN04487970_103960 [Paenibacillus tianmuensis]
MYVEKLNSTGFTGRLETISQYGIAISQFDPTNKNDIKSLKDIHDGGIPKYKDFLKFIRELKAPEEYQSFHKLLDDSISNFIGSMEEMDQHLDNVKETDHLKKSTEHYIAATESMKKIVKELPYGDLK